MSAARLNDPLQLTVFDASPLDFDQQKEESLLGKVLRRVTGNHIRLGGSVSPNSSRRGSSNDAAAYTTGSGGSLSGPQVELHRGGDVSTMGGSGQTSLGASVRLSSRSSIAPSSDGSNQAEAEQMIGSSTRTLGCVLQRLKAIAAKGNDKDPQPFRDSDFKHFWVPDSLSRECYECGERFTTFRRRRHCRICGQIFCGRCADEEVPGHLLGYSGTMRMCSFCSQVVLSRARYLEPSPQKASSAADGRMHTPSPSLVSSTSKNGLSDQNRYHLFSGQPQDGQSDQDLLPPRKLSEELRGITCDQLREIWLEMNHVTDGVELKIHRHRFRAFPDCVSGVEVVDWLVKRGKATSRKEAVKIGQGLINYKFLECLTTTDMIFLDEYVLYKPKTVTNELEDASILLGGSEFVENEEPTWLQEIELPVDRLRSQGGETLADSADEPPYLNFYGAKKRMRRTDSNVSLNSQMPEVFTSNTEASSISAMNSAQTTTQISEETAFRNAPELDLWRNPDHTAQSGSAVDSASTSLDRVFQQRLDTLLQQLADWEGLGGEWHDLILSLAVKVTENVVPSVRENHDDMDIRQYVHIKTIPGGKASESAVVFGAVCSKHVAHRKMRQSFVNPKILLYGAALEYQPIEDKFNSLEPVLQEEAEFLKNCVASISEFQPDILLVERNVSRLAQDYLFNEGITLVANVKPSIMERISRCTGADKFSLLEGHLSQPHLGTCSRFDVRTIDLQPYMTFDGCPRHLGCTVLIRGATKEVLRKVKKILLFTVYCHYNWILEKAFLMDEHAKIPDAFLLRQEASSDKEWKEGFLAVMASFVSSISPLIQPNIPFLLTETGKRSAARLRLPDKLFWSKKTESRTADVSEALVAHEGDSSPDSSLLPIHPLLQMHMTASVNTAVVQGALANFRATGGRLEMPKRHGDGVPLSASLSPLKSPSKKNTPLDCFDVYRHQRLPVLCSIHAVESTEVMASFCVFPWTLVINYYGKNDLTLGDYLETFCFRLDAHCPNQQCTRGVKEHVRRFASGDAAISVTLRDFDNGNGPPLSRIVTWTWCRLCRKVSSVVALSSASWSLSFARYIELRLHAAGYQADGLSECTHSLHRDHVQYFAYGQTVAAFNFSLVRLREIDSPHMVINVDDYRNMLNRQELIEMTKTVAIKGHNVFATIADYLTTCHSLDLDKLEEKLNALSVLKRAEKGMFKDWLECLQLKLASPLLKFDPVTSGEADQLRDFIWDIEDSVNSLKRKITETAIIWSANLNEIELIKKKEERKHHATLKSFQSTPEFLAHDPDALPMPCVVSVLVDPPDADGTAQQTRFLLGTEESDAVGEEYMNIDFAGSPKSDSNQLRHSVTSVSFAPTASADGVDAANIRSMSRQKSVQPTGATNIVPYPFPPNEHFMVGETDRVPVVVYDDQLSSIIAFALSSTDYGAQLEELTRPFRKELHTSRNVSGDSSSAVHRVETQTVQSTEKEGLSPAMTFLRHAAEGNLPFGHVEHSMSGLNVETSDTDTLDVPSKTAEVTSIRPKSANKTTPEAKHYIEVQFGDQVAKFYCRIYFPEEFRLFRAMVFPYGEDRFIRSLSRCVAWKATGGKSGSTFSKTADGRFVLKQMSRLEVQSFMEFAPHYFTYMAQTAKEKRPTVIAKVVGVYRIGFRNSLTGAQVKQDLLVMENLFYGRKIQQVYDLKGSLRNRLASTDAKADAELVLLDENFLKRICDNPLYIRPHAKIFIRKALQSDTQFLANLYVMDYSLLVGIDDESKEIIVGIIDYIRTFTWDKRLEMVVKSTNLLGGQKVLPTIVSPELYRTRFCEAMERYFLPVPDEWYGLARYAEGI